MEFKSWQIITGITAYDGTKKCDGSPDENGKTIDSEQAFPTPFWHVEEVEYEKSEVSKKQKPY